LGECVFFIFLDLLVVVYAIILSELLSPLLVEWFSQVVSCFVLRPSWPFLDVCFFGHSFH